MPKVVFVNRFFFPDISATSQMLSDLAMQLAGAEVHVVCSRQLYEDAHADLAAHEVLGNVHIHRVWTGRFGRTRLLGRAFDYASFYFMSTLKLLRLVGRSDVLIAMTDPPLLSVPAALVAKLRRATLVNWLQDVFPEVASRLGVASVPKWLDLRLRWVRDRSLASAATNIVLGARMSDYLASRGVARNRMVIVENWADGTAVRPMPASQSKLRAHLGLGDHFVVAYSGNLGHAHEFETILSAAELLRAHPDFAFLMIGGGIKMQALQRLVAQRGLTSFRFLPYQPRAALADSLAAADVHLACLLPSLEGLIVPSKLYGILAAGRPTIFIGDVDGELARVIRNADCGLAVACGEGPVLASALETLRSDRARTRLMGQTARELFEARYTLGIAVEKWIKLLNELDVRIAASCNTADMRAG